MFAYEDSDLQRTLLQEEASNVFERKNFHGFSLTSAAFVFTTNDFSVDAAKL
jgi:hypothetical protein